MKKTLLSWLGFGFVILGFSIVFYFIRLVMGNFDEYDHLAAGYLMKNGQLLYKDIFTHHFPLPYYWTLLFTPLWSENPSRTVSIFRLAVLGYYLASFTLIFATLKKISTKILFYIWIILISMIMVIYQGHLVLSETFAAIALMGVFWTSIPVAMGWEKLTKFHLFAQIIFASLALWTQPLYGILFVVPLILGFPKNLKMVIFTSLIVNILPIFLLFLSGQFADFYEQTIWFNSAVYSKYYGTEFIRGNHFVAIIQYFFQNEFKLLTSIQNPLQIFQFIVHLGLVGLFGYLIKTKQKLPILILGILLLVSRMREVKIITGEPFVFGIYPLILLALASTLILLYFIYKKSKLITTAIVLILFSVAIIPSYPFFTQSLDPQYNYHVFWSYRQDKGDIIKKLSEPSEKILVYPHDVDLYYFADRKPIDRFLYWFPWVDDVPQYRNERLSALNQNPPSVVYIGSLAFHEEKRFYAKFFLTIIIG
ncbi:MAG: hypothetical protein ACEQSA_05475, partial [Weeksellaceae bacterium]